MNCPRGCNTELLEKEREGVTMDICPECRGLWLDRGELERLIARAQRDFDDEPRWSKHEDKHYKEKRERPKKKKRWFESLTDVLDFG